VEDEDLRAALLSPFAVGELHMQLGDLLRNLDTSNGLVSPPDTAGSAGAAILHELQQGNLFGTVLQVAVSSTTGDQRLMVNQEQEDVIATVQAMLSGEATDDVIIRPAFRQASWPLVEAVLRWCRRERVTTSLNLVQRILRTFLCDSLSFSDIDLIVLLPTQEPRLVDVSLYNGLPTIKGWEDTNKPPNVHTVEAEAQDRAAINGEDIEGHVSNDVLQQLIALCPPAGEPPHEDLPFVVAVARVPRLAEALRLPKESKDMCGGTLLWALDRLTRRSRAGGGDAANANGYIAPVDPADDSRIPRPTAPGPLPEAPGTTVVPCSNEVQCTAADVQTMATKAAPVVECGLLKDSPVEEADNRLLDDEAFDHKMKVDDQDDLLWETTNSESNWPGVTTSLDDVNGIDAEAPKASIIKSQVAFVDCFHSELAGQRPLLLSQLNNLYMMRSGKNLPYKECGYEKLRDFLVDIPGISVAGRGNRMQVRLVDNSEIEELRNSWQAQEEADGERESAQNFHMPAAIPQYILNRLGELFLCAENNEICLRNVIEAWNSKFPNEPLEYKKLGFRDLRGFLSQVTFIEKVGSKCDQKYVLRAPEARQYTSNLSNNSAAVSLAQHDARALSQFPRACLPQRGGASGDSCIPGVSDHTLDGVSAIGRSSASQMPPGTSYPSSSSRTLNLRKMHPATGLDAFLKPAETLKMLPEAAEASNPFGGFSPATSRPRYETVGCPRGEALSRPRGCSDFPAVAPIDIPRASPPGFWNSPPQLDDHRIGERKPQNLRIENMRHLLGIDTGPPLKSVPLRECGDPEEPMSPTGSAMTTGHVRKLASKKQVPCFFVSAPGAFSSDTRDASIHQGKFDMGSVLQTQLPQDVACLVCDIETGKILVSNEACEELFCTAGGTSQLVHEDIFGLLDDSGSTQFATNLAYLMVSVRTRMDPVEVRIRTESGLFKTVVSCGVQLVGSWWQFEFR